MKFDDLSKETRLLHNSFIRKNRKKETYLITKDERDAYNLYMRLYRLQPHRNKKANDFSTNWKVNNHEKNNKTKIKWAKEHYDTHVYPAQDRWRKKNIVKMRIYFREWMRENGHKYKKQRYARELVRRAIKAGKLKRPENCSRCPSKIRIEGHHPDYDKPLDVIWLCSKCHGKEHRKSNLHSETE